MNMLKKAQDAKAKNSKQSNRKSVAQGKTPRLEQASRFKTEADMDAQLAKFGFIRGKNNPYTAVPEGQGFVGVTNQSISKGKLNYLVMNKAK